MNKAQALTAVSGLTKKQQTKWLMLLGHNLTIAARTCYVPGHDTGDPKLLVAFNEMQHHVYNELLLTLSGDNWGPEQLLISLCERAKAANCLPDVVWAIRNSLRLVTLQARTPLA